MHDMIIYVPKTTFVGYHESIRVREMARYIQRSGSHSTSTGEIDRSVGVLYSFLIWLDTHFSEIPFHARYSEKEREDFKGKIHAICEELRPFQISQDSGIFLKHDCRDTMIRHCNDAFLTMIDKAF